METKVVNIDGHECEIKILTFEDVGRIQSAGTKLEYVGRTPTPKIDIYQLQLTTIMRGLVKIDGQAPELSKIRNMKASTAEAIYNAIDEYNKSPSEQLSDTEGEEDRNE
jgi:hypothetical protein